MARLLAAIIILAGSAATSAAGQSFVGDLSGVREIIITIGLPPDNASCVPTEAVLRAEVEPVLRSADLSILSADEDSSLEDLEEAASSGFETFRATLTDRPYYFVVALAAVQSGSQCAVAYDFRLWRPEVLMPDVMDGLALFFNYGGVMMAPPVVMRQHIREHTGIATTQLANAILRAK